MKDKFVSTLAVCPFYQAENKQMIICDGITDGSHIKLTFDTSTLAKAYKKQFCKNRYFDCCIYAMLEVCYEVTKR